MPELLSELKQRSQRIIHLEAQILSAKRTPQELVQLSKKIEEGARAKLDDLRSALADQADLREVFLTLFPSGLTFTADRTPDGERAVWRITGNADFGSLVGPSGPDCVATPTGFEVDANTCAIAHLRVTTRLRMHIDVASCALVSTGAAAPRQQLRTSRTR